LKEFLQSNLQELFALARFVQHIICVWRIIAMLEIRKKILSDITEERQRQIAKFGPQYHDFPVWMTVLGEEVGEACQALLDSRKLTSTTPAYAEQMQMFREELIQVAAVAVAAIERIDIQTQVSTPVYDFGRHSE
jgi:NTP pyrophosphatase (non-canonical NTP hydrolase)